jgi:hypothetical protein
MGGAGEGALLGLAGQLITRASNIVCGANGGDSSRETTKETSVRAKLVLVNESRMLGNGLTRHHSSEQRRPRWRRRIARLRRRAY